MDMVGFKVDLVRLARGEDAEAAHHPPEEALFLKVGFVDALAIDELLLTADFGYCILYLDFRA